MAMDFPASPSEGQVFAPGGGAPSYTYKAPAWRSGVIGIPAPPSDGSAYVMRNGLWEKAGWRVLYRIAPAAAGTTTVVFPLGGAKTIRISGVFRPTVVSSYLYMRLSYDGGATYKSGASDYYDAIMRQQQTTLTGVAYSASTGLFLSGNSDAVSLNAIPINGMFSNGDATRLFKGFSTNTGQWGGGANGPTLDTHHGWSATLGTATHANIFCGAGSFDVGTDIVVEAPS